MSVFIRPFRPDEWKVFRDFRLAALVESPGLFFSPHAREAAFPDVNWQAMLSHRLHEATMGWILAQPQFRRVVISHRESNTASRGGILAAGFVETARTGPWDWPDGTQEDDIAYEYRIA